MSLLDRPRYFATGGSADGWSVLQRDGREWERFYRERWQHDKVVRSTHGVNCTGSCSWKIHVKDGIVTWETQQTDYPSNGPDVPEYEPRGCPRGASFSWYVYSPIRVRYPYVRGVLLEMFREARARHGGDPVEAWASIVEDPETRARLQVAARQGRLRPRDAGTTSSSWSSPPTSTRCSRYGPDRVAGFSPIPAMSMVSYAAGTRFLSLIGGVCLSFYDWYADLPPASPQIWGDQTDVPESADWWNAELHDPLGLEHPADPDARRALHDRGALPGPEGRGRLAGLRRAHEVRRPLAARRGRHRRRARDGDGAP